jgi:hypothetical protein
MLTELLGWRSRIEILSIRPQRQLPGSAFSGFFDRTLRRDYISEGRRAARLALLQTSR